MAAVIALGEMSVHRASTVAALTERLEDEMPFVRVLAAIALARIGRGAAESMPALRKAAEDRNLTLSVRAGQALRAIQGGSYLE